MSLVLIMFQSLETTQHHSSYFSTPTWLLAAGKSPSSTLHVMLTMLVTETLKSNANAILRDPYCTPGL